MKAQWFYVPNKPWKYTRAFVRLLERSGEIVTYEDNGSYWHIYVHKQGLESFM